jgi:hypothetical protein
MNFICDKCFCVIKDTEICAVAEKSIFVTCCDCLSQRCCVRGCQKTHLSEYICLKNELKFTPMCNRHAGRQCAHDLSCIGQVTKDSFYCSEHRCRWFMASGKRCTCESLQTTSLCPYHSSQSRQIKK